MLVEFLYTKEHIPYRAFSEIKKQQKQHPFMSDYDFAFFILPLSFGAKESEFYLRKFFSDRPFVAFYSSYIGTPDGFFEEFPVAVFFKRENTAWGDFSLKTYSLEKINLKELLREYNLPQYIHLLIVPGNTQPKEFLKFFVLLRETITNLKTKIVGWITGGDHKNGYYPVFTHNKTLKEKEFIVLSFGGFNYEAKTLIEFTPIGPPFEFERGDLNEMVKIDEKPALDLFKEVLPKDFPLDHIVALPLSIKPVNGSSFVKKPPLVRFPKELDTRRGTLTFWADLPKKGSFQFIYLRNLDKKFSRVFIKTQGWDFGLFLNCYGRRFYLEPKEEYQILKKHFKYPFLMVSSFGEFSTVRGRLNLFNGTNTFLLLRENLNLYKDS
ncbi:MAG: hypothetical protein GXN97_05705 [Aquificae bacterium]|nr:hypothetical protein [Aquificota bacterium]